jgi:transposase
LFRKRRAVQESLFIPGKLSDFIPEDHILVRANKAVDLSWVDDLVSDTYNHGQGRPCIEPERALRLMLCGFLHGITEDRKLMREAQVNIAYRWFCGYELDESLPDHSSFTIIRQRWGAERFRKIFERLVKQCVSAGIVGGEALHFDGSLIRADVSWESLVATYVEKTLEENPAPEGSPTTQADSDSTEQMKAAKPKGKIKKVSRTDPDASMATSSKKMRLEPTYKQHTCVDDKAGVIVDVEVTTGEISENHKLISQIDRVTQTLGKKPELVTADKGYASGSNYEALENRGITAVIPPQKERRPVGNMPLCRFSYDAEHDVVRCPGGRILTRRNRNEHGWFYRCATTDCRDCPLKSGCVPENGTSRSIIIVDGYCSLLRARREKRRGWDDEKLRLYNRHRNLVEGAHGEQKTQHGLRRATRRGLWNVQIQSYLSAMAVDLKRLAAHASNGNPGSLVPAMRWLSWHVRRIWGHVGFCGYDHQSYNRGGRFILVSLHQ